MKTHIENKTTHHKSCTYKTNSNFLTHENKLWSLANETSIFHIYFNKIIVVVENLKYQAVFLLLKSYPLIKY